MPASVADSAIYRKLFGDAEVAALFTDMAEIRAILLVEGALAKVQGELDIIPQPSAAFLYNASYEALIDPAALADATAVNGVPIPALLAAFRKAVAAPEHTDWLHWGATSQDIIDTGLVLRLKRLFDIWEARLTALIEVLAELAEQHANLPMAGRTYGQIATPTTFGAVVASWGRPLLRHQERLQSLKSNVLKVSLSGAAGTLSAMGARGPEVRSALARELGLADPGSSWHSERDSFAELAGWMAALTASLSKMGEDLILMNQTEVGEVKISDGGSSSTMPQKQNPIIASVVVALGKQVGGLAAVLISAGVHNHQRDGTAWYTEWLTLPQACISTSRALSLSVDLMRKVTPVGVTMQRDLVQCSGLIFAEALTFALAAHMPRPDAEAAVKSLCREAANTGADLRELALKKWHDTDLSDALNKASSGDASEQARAFCRLAKRSVQMKAV